MTRNIGRLVAGLALALAALTGCQADSQSELDAAKDNAVDAAKDQVDTALDDADLPNINLDKYSQKLQNRLENLTDNADCAGLKKELTKAEGNDTDLTEFIKAQIEQLDC